MRKKRTYTLNGESPTITEEVIDRFEQNVDTSTPDGCWPWTGKPHQGSGGRGRFTAHGITDYAYRWMACLLGFLLNEKDVVNHKCNNPICVRPDHLEVTDRKGDAMHRAMQERGVGKLSAENVRTVRRRRSQRAPDRRPTQRELAEELGVNPSTISNVERRVTYNWVKEE